ncbi:MAG: c-type cytochrome [Solirubrobacterales bacterium]
MRILGTTLLVLATLGLAACGGSSNDSSSSSDSSGSGGTTTQQGSGSGSSGGGGEGEQIFAANCATCHTLSAAGASGAVGPNLDDDMPTEAEVKSQVTNGGGAMPSFSGTLDTQQIDAVSKYVSSVAGQ